MRHNLALSGMAGALRSVPRLLKNPAPANPDQLRATLAELHRVHPAEVFLTHGAHEANFLALSFLAVRARRTSGRLTLRLESPEYPQLLEAAAAVGADLASRSDAAQVWALSNPNNPTGKWRSAREILQHAGGIPIVLVDEAYREFTNVPSVASTADEKLWATGTFTKVFGADEIRVGWSIPPPSEMAEYARFHAVAADRVAERSIRSAMAILSAREKVLREVRRIFDRNVEALHLGIPGSETPAGPVWFDQGNGTLPGDRVQAAALRRSILVCSGTFFGDPRGVRVCLTRSSFPSDLSRYLKVRNTLR